MTKKIYDLVVIGSGPAARRAAIQASKFGKNVFPSVLQAASSVL